MAGKRHFVNFMISFLAAGISHGELPAKWPRTLPFVYQRQDAFPNGGEMYCFPSAIINGILALQLSGQIHEAIDISKDTSIVTKQLAGCIKTDERGGSVKTNYLKLLRRCVNQISNNQVDVVFDSWEVQPKAQMGPTVIPWILENFSQGRVALFVIGKWDFGATRRRGGHALLAVEGVPTKRGLDIVAIDSDNKNFQITLPFRFIKGPTGMYVENSNYYFGDYNLGLLDEIIFLMPRTKPEAFPPTQSASQAPAGASALDNIPNNNSIN